MTHPRLAVSEMCTYKSPFSDELQLWDELDIRLVGLLLMKVEVHGRDRALGALRDRSMTATTIITRNFDLSAPDSWDVTRADINRAVDLAVEVGGVPYFTPGRRDGRTFDELMASLAEAVAPCVTFAEAKGVRLAIEPSLRTDQSFVHTLRDAIDVADAAGIGLVADLGNCWMERDVEATVRRAGPRIAAVQFADALFGTTAKPSPGGRVVPGDGDLDIQGFIEAIVASGYSGPFELEMVGPAIESEGPCDATRRAVGNATKLLERVLI
jgi:sugar phosphate isomerase/epimerase